MSGTLICGKTTGNAVVPVQVNADGTLEMTAEIDSSALAKETTLDSFRTDNASNLGVIATTLDDGTQKAMCMGNDSGLSQKQILVSNTGVVQTLDSEVFGKTSQIANQTTLSNTNEATIIANQTNGTQIATVGNTVGDGSGTATHLKTASDGSVHVVVENSDNVLIKGVQDGTTTQKDAKTNSNGDLRSALIGNTAKDGTGDNYYVLVDSDGKLETSGGGGGGSANTNLYPTLASITTATNFAGGIINSNYIDLTNAKNVFVNCIHTGDAAARSDFGQDVSISMEFTDDNTSTVCYSGSSNPVFAFATIDAEGNSTGVAVAELSLGNRSDASGAIKGKFGRVSCVNNNNSGNSTAYAVTFKVVIDGI
tara:strand:+ start:17564 stop:18664 length:1101 start_codon:yes stop_codon:yes gene_type:complete